MNRPYDDAPYDDPFDNPGRGNPPKRSNTLMWILGLVGAAFVLCCGGGIAGLTYIGIAGPEISVYPGSQVPADYVEIAKDVGGLEDGEKIDFFYSDAIIDIRQGFYYVSDRKVVIYSEDGRDPALKIVKFDDIELLEISKSNTTFDDSEIMIKLKDGQWVAFPVSQEHSRDQLFYDSINEKRPMPDLPAERL